MRLNDGEEVVSLALVDKTEDAAEEDEESATPAQVELAPEVQEDGDSQSTES
jgi:hypothetical protein